MGQKPFVKIKSEVILEAVNLEAKLALFTEHFKPRTVGELIGQDVTERKLWLTASGNQAFGWRFQRSPSTGSGRTEGEAQGERVRANGN